MDLEEHLGGGVAELRRDPQAMLTNEAGLRRAYVTRLEAAQQNPTLGVLERIAVALKVTVEASLTAIHGHGTVRPSCTNRSQRVLMISSPAETLDDDVLRSLPQKAAVPVIFVAAGYDAEVHRAVLESAWRNRSPVRGGRS